MGRHRSRREFSWETKLEAWERCKGHCEGCGQKIVQGNGPEYHHEIPDYFEGPPSLGNCRVLCIRPCHKRITADRDRPAIDKSRRIRRRQANAKHRTGFRGWRKFDGTPVWK